MLPSEARLNSPLKIANCGPRRKACNLSNYCGMCSFKKAMADKALMVVMRNNTRIFSDGTVGFGEPHPEDTVEYLNKYLVQKEKMI